MDSKSESHNLEDCLTNLCAVARALQELVTYHQPSPETKGLWADVAGSWSGAVHEVETAILAHRSEKAAEARRRFNRTVYPFWEGEQNRPRKPKLGKFRGNPILDRWEAPEDLDIEVLRGPDALNPPEPPEEK
jgi:hypothetical protein